MLNEVQSLKDHFDSTISGVEKKHSSIEAIENILSDNEFSFSYIQIISDRLKRSLTIDELENMNLVKGKVSEWIGESISINNEDNFNLSKVVILVGPTGVGKTTTIAKLAANHSSVTRSKYAKVIEWANNNVYDFTDETLFGRSATVRSSSFDPNEPVSYSTWFEGVKFCNALSEMEDRIPCYYGLNAKVYREGICDEPQVKWNVNGYRLPTRAEWEYAATAGTHFAWWWEEGYTKINDYAEQHFDNTAKKLSAFTVWPLGNKKPNPFGLYGLLMTANLCNDWHGSFVSQRMDTIHPKGCSRQESIDSYASIFQGFYFAVRETAETEGAWGVGACQGDFEWSALRSHYGWRAGRQRMGIRVVISGERGDENKELPVLHNFLDDLSEPVVKGSVSENLELVTIPKGDFELGSSLNSIQDKMFRAEKRSVFDERPGHKVRISSFKLAKYETTVAQWNKVYNWAIKNGYKFTNKGDKGNASSADLSHPIVNMLWIDVIKWCNAASEMKKLTPCYTFNGQVYKKGDNNKVACNWKANGYRLPTEAEWEYAAYDGEKNRAFYWGDNYDGDYCWFAGWEGNSATDQDKIKEWVRTREPNWQNKMWHKLGKEAWSQENIPHPLHPSSHPVGQKIGNKFGLYDTFGNVWEMCWDMMAPYSMTINDRINPKGPKSKEYIADYFKNDLFMYSGAFASLTEYSHGDKKGGNKQPQNFGSRVIKGCGYRSKLGRCARWGPFLTTRSEIIQGKNRDDVGFRVARGK